MKPTEEQSRFIEKVGRFWETGTGSRTAGRIIGWLMICEPDHQSSADLVEALDVSAGSVSTQVRLLEQFGLAERITFPGERATYYRLPDKAWSRLMDRELPRIVEMRKLAEAADGVLPETRRERVTEMASVAAFFVDEWPSLLDRLSEQLQKEQR